MGLELAGPIRRRMMAIYTRYQAKVGEVFWVVVEHFYTPKDSCLCEKEYCCKRYICCEIYRMLMDKYQE